VTDYFAESNRHYIVMEYVPGETLEDRLARQRTPCSEQEVRGWAEQLCDVLAYPAQPRTRPSSSATSSLPTSC
jgi:serine/threonine protein kinase